MGTTHHRRYYLALNHRCADRPPRTRVCRLYHRRRRNRQYRAGRSQPTRDHCAFWEDQPVAARNLQGDHPMSSPTLQRTPFLTDVWVIAKREITTRLASKGFVIPTANVLAVIIIGSVLGPRVTDMFSSTDQVAVTQETQPVIGEIGRASCKERGVGVGGDR